MVSFGLLARPGGGGLIEEMHPPASDLQDHLHPAVRLAKRHATINQLVFNILRRQPILQHPEDEAGLFLLLEDVTAATAQQPVEKGH